MAGPWDDYTDQTDSAPPVDDTTGSTPDTEQGPWSDFASQQTAAPSPAPAPAPVASQATSTPDDPNGPWNDHAASPEESSATGAFARGFAKGVAPTLGSLPAIGAGAEVGAAIGAPLGPVGAGAGGVLGGIAGAVGAGYLISKAQDWVLDKLGLSNSAQDNADAQQHPYAQEAGSLGAGMLAFGTGAASGLTRLAGAGIFGGLEAGQEAVQEGKVDPTKVALAAGAGAVAPNPREYAERLMGVGTAAARAVVPGRPDVKLDPAATAEKTTVANANDQPIVAKGVATEQPPVNEDVSVGRAPDNKPVRSERTYAKDNVPAGGGIVTAPTERGINTDFMTPDQVAALQGSLDQGSIHNQRQAPATPVGGGMPGEQQLPIATGLDKLRPPQAGGEAQPAPQGEQPQAAPVPETAPAATYPHPEIEGLTVDRRRSVPTGVASDKGIGTVFVDKNLPPSIDVGGKKIDPAVPLSVREVVFRNALKHAMSAPEGQRLPAATLRQAAMEVGQDAEKHWLTSRGYDYDAYKEALGRTGSAQPAGEVKAPVPAQEQPAAEVPAARAPEQAEPGLPAAPEAQPSEASTGLDKLAGTAPDVTATVTRPKVVDQALAEIDKRVQRSPQLAQVRDALVNAEPEKQALLARKVMEMVSNRTGAVKAQGDYATARIPSKPAEVEGMNVTARSKADAERKGSAYAAVKSAFDKFAPTDDVVPTSATQKQAFKDRLLGAIQHANEQNGGKDPISAYKPRVKPKEWQWLNMAQKLAKGRMTQRQISEFIANEKLLRSGNDEDANIVRQGNRVDADIAMNRAPTTETADLAGAFRDREFPGEIVPAEDVPGTERPATAEDITPQTEKTLDLSKLDEGQAAELKEQTDRVSRNLIDMDNKQRAKQLEAEATAERTGKLKQAREAAALATREVKPSLGESEGAASPVRNIAVTDEMKKQAMENWAKAQERSKSRGAPEAMPAEPVAQVPRVRDLADFFKDRDGKLDIEKVRQDIRTRLGQIREGSKKYFGVPDGDIARKAEVVLGQTMTAKQQLDARVLHATDADWHAWNKVKVDDTMTFLHAMEEHPDLDRGAFKQVLETSGIKPEDAGWMADSRETQRKLYDEMFKFEAEHGSKAEYRAGYVRHVFADEAGVQKWLTDTYMPTLGANGFQKARAFDTIAAAMKAGFKLKFDNPIDILTSRWKMGVNSSLLTASLRRLRQDGLAEQVGDESLSKVRKGAIRDWYKFNNAMDGTQWAIHPDAQALWHNAMEGHGLVELNNPVGSVYRGWMQVKNVWAPLELAFNAFHAVHIVGINMAQNLATAIRTAASTGEWAQELKTAGKLSLDQSLFSWPVDKIKIGGIGDKLDALSGNKFSNNVGRNVMDFWKLPRSQMTPQQRMTADLLHEMNVVPENSRQEMIGAKRSLARALSHGEYMKAIPAAVRRGIEKIQAPLFNYMIPQMKVEAALNSAASAFRRDPELLVNRVKRQQVMREIGQNIHDRYGEMFYDSMFWNKYVKDVGIGSMLSLSWNLGQARQAFGAARSAYVTGRELIGKPVNFGRDRLGGERYKATDKGTFVASYVGLSMGMAGLMSYALSGQLPSGLDYVFPRNGLTNPDGTPARLSTPFNTREVPMLAGHVQEHGNIVGGAMAFLWNKMILSPITEAWNNRDFFGRELYDPNAPWYKRAVQLVDSTLGNHLSPISLSGMDRVRAGGGGTGMKALALAGFGPAPKYVSNDGWQNRINDMYFQNAGPRAYEYGQKTGLGRGLVQGAIRAVAGDKLGSEQMQEGREHLNQGYATKNEDLMRQGRQEMVKAGVSARYVGRFRPEQEFQYKFSRLPPDQQRGLYQTMDDQAKQTYVMRNPILSKNARFKIMKP